MKTIYQVTASPIGDRGASQVDTIHKTETEAQWSAIEHYVKTEGGYAYRIMKCVLTKTEGGWQRVGATYIVGGRLVTEPEWLEAGRG
jgi:hypothetical protein